MKKRHEQKLVILAIVLFIVYSLPFILILNIEGHVFGIPIFYFSLFLIWLISIILSYSILKRYYD